MNTLAIGVMLASFSGAMANFLIIAHMLTSHS